MSGLFVTGTDTGCGKTEITLLLMRLFQGHGLKVVGMKPIASGAQQTAQGLRNEDAIRIQAQCSIALPYKLVNPYAFEPPIAPHIAAQQAGTAINIGHILEIFDQLNRSADLVIVEGVGGVQVPLNDNETVVDLIKHLKLPTILVAGLKLGCINHALLSVESIQRQDIPLIGWISNQIEAEMQEQQANIDSLKKRIDPPHLGHLPFFHGEYPDSTIFDSIWGFLPDSIRSIM